MGYFMEDPWSFLGLKDLRQPFYTNAGMLAQGWLPDDRYFSVGVFIYFFHAWGRYTL